MLGDLKRIVLDYFTKRNKDIITEVKTGIIEDRIAPVIVMALDFRNSVEGANEYIDDFIYAIISVSRGIGGKGSEQLLNLIYPMRQQEIFMPHTIKESEKKEEKKGFMSRLMGR